MSVLFLDTSSNFHPWECDGYGFCIHCDRKRTKDHNPKTCALCASDEIPRPPIKGACFVCGVTQADVDANKVIVSPSGRAHYTNGFESTRCGKDATGNEWWWPL